MSNSSESDRLPFPNENDKWTVYGAAWCGPCKKTKAFLTEKGEEYVYYDVDKYDFEEAQEEMGKLTDNYKYIPIIFREGKFIGGFTELIKQSDFVDDAATEATTEDQ